MDEELKNEMGAFDFHDISKSYPGVQALENVSITLCRGEVMALVGENGAGKSTFVKVAGGIVRPDSGTIRIEGKLVAFQNPKQAMAAGIAIVHQELSLFPNLDVASNLFIHHLDENSAVFINEGGLRERARAILKKVGLPHISPRRKVNTLQPGEQQLVEIGRALVSEARLLFLDEPTSSLAEKEIQTLFRIIRDLKSEGISIVFVSHRLDEIFEICDRVTVLRDGNHIITQRVNELDQTALIRHILGRQMSEMYQQVAYEGGGEVLLRVDDIWQRPKLKGLSFELHAGEILGISGLLGSGRTELMRVIFGLDRKDEGEIYLNGKKVRIASPEEAINLGIGYITEDRHKEGLVLEKSIRDNIVMASLKQFASWFGWMRPQQILKAARRQKENLNIVTPSVRRLVKYLSGGNQQKVVLGKWLETKPEIYILDEPTRGIDVGAKSEFYKLINELAAEGAGIIFISSELQEIVNTCHRVLVMRNGAFVADYAGQKINAADILYAATGGA
jgi:ribose transport system ATP-binding protein